MVYLREAHPKGGWEIGDWSVFEDAKTLLNRKIAATECCRQLKFEFPAVVDEMDDRVAIQWSGWPERLFVVSKDGRVVYTGDMGPYGFKPSKNFEGFGSKKPNGISLEGFLDSYLALKESTTRVAEFPVGEVNE